MSGKFVVGILGFAGALAVAVVGVAASSTPAQAEKTAEQSITIAEATKVTEIRVPGTNDDQQNVVIFESVHEGVPVTCTTKTSFRAGVTCIPSIVTK